MRFKFNIAMHLKGTGFQDEGWLDLAEDGCYLLVDSGISGFESPITTELVQLACNREVYSLHLTIIAGYEANRGLIPTERFWTCPTSTESC
jgi:hypothetical protein